MPNTKICSNGHYYDGNRYTECPYCKTPVAGGETKPLEPETPEEGVTQALENVDLVVGWLVCVDGPDRGKDYHLYGGNNYVGRGSSNDVSLSGDMTVSSAKQFNVAFDERHCRFFISSTGGKAIVYLNDEPVSPAVQTLKKGDCIEVGKTKLLFVPLCGEDFDWEKKEEGAE